jgi:TPR repeat protein
VVLAWADTRNGQAQHDSTSHALSVIEQLGYESGAYDTYIRTDSNIVARQPLTTTGTPASGGPSLASVDAIFFLGQALISGNLGQTKDIPEGVRWLEIIATKANDTRAMALLAQTYLKGDGVPQNEERAVVLFRSLGERGNGPAWRVLAGLSHEGRGGLSADPSVMAGFLAKGVALGDPASHFFLGELYLRGEGVMQNDREAFRLIELAAEGGDFNAMLALANIFIKGSAGQSVDEETAFKWLSVVVNRAPPGDAYFQASLAVQQMRQQLSDAAIGRAQEEAGKFQARKLPAQNPPAAKP